jgi:dipeptidyl aminopeptidase/acylaminoacyl peptidase
MYVTRLLSPIAALAAIVALAPTAPARAEEAAKGASVTAVQDVEMRLDDLFPKKWFFGKAAASIAWSHDDRYVAYRWNAYDDKGYDLWVYDTRDRKAARLTSAEQFLPFDRTLKEVIEQMAKDKAEDIRRRGLSRDERTKLEEQDEKKEKERKEPLKTYAAVGEFTWAHHSDTILLTYKGDIFRLEVGKSGMQRLTKTQEGESGIEFTKDDRGFTFNRGGGLYRMAFGSADMVQLNPELPDGMKMNATWVSPDETKALILCSKGSGRDREVTYISYRNRFAEAKTTGRNVADDPFNSEQRLYIVDLVDDPKVTPFNDGKPWEIWKWPAGEEMGQAVLHEKPWSADSKRVAFATWKRTKRELEISTADVGKKQVAAAYKSIHNGEHTSPGLTDPQFLPDGRLLCLLEQTGHRQVWVIDPQATTATQLTKGDFEVYPVKLSEDGKTLIVRSNREQPARMDAYNVSVADGAMTRLTSRDGTYGSITVSHKMGKIAATHVSWTSQREMCILDDLRIKREDVVTSSHGGGWQQVSKLTPELISFKNRLGQSVSGFVFKPLNWKKTDQHPLLVYVYGGPLGEGKMVEDGSIGMDGYLWPMWMAWKHGYLCATIDPRGSSGYGAAFGSANWEQPGKAQVEDLKDAVKYLTEQYGVDPKRVGVHGWSFGGFQTQMCMYTAGDVFTLGIAGAGPTEWQNYNNWYAGGVIGPAKVGKPDELDRFSLTHLAKNLKGPLMLLHGMEDTNVLYQDTVKVYRELQKARKGPLVELVVDPTGDHGLGGDIKTRDRFAIYEAFVLRRWGK